MLHLRGSQDLGPDPEFLIPLLQTRECSGRMILKVTQQVKTGLRQESLLCAQASGKLTTSRPKGPWLVSAPSPGVGAPVGPSRAGRKPARAAPWLPAECLLPRLGGPWPAAQRGEGAGESALPGTGARLRVYFLKFCVRAGSRSARDYVAKRTLSSPGKELG